MSNSKRKSRSPPDKEPDQPTVEGPFDISKYTLNTLQDLINMTVDYCKGPPQRKRAGLKLHKLPLILEELFRLNEMIGLEKLKTQLLYQILYYLDDNEKMLMHTVIEGPPGSGKTTVAQLMGIIYSKLGILKKQKFKILGRADLIGEYLGETTQKTLEALESCKNGVAFIDEAYSLGNPDSRSDSYSKEAIDTINQYLLENKDSFICIIAGYKEELEQCFFSKNPGLKRRFPWVFTIEPYSPKDLLEIFHLKTNTWKCDVSDDYILGLFNKHKAIIVNNGGDIDILIQFAKIFNTRRNFGKSKNNTIETEDIDYAFKELALSRQVKTNSPPPLMYI